MVEAGLHRNSPYFAATSEDDVAENSRLSPPRCDWHCVLAARLQPSKSREPWDAEGYWTLTYLSSLLLAALIEFWSDGRG